MYFCMSNSVMYEQEFQGDILYMMLYAVVAVLNLVACCYLLFRQGNAFAADVTPPMRLRRWTAVFFAANTLCHLWYLPTYFLTSSDDRMLGYLIAGLLDSMTVIPLMTVILLVMLQDRRRPLWPVAVMVVPLVAGSAWSIATRNDDFMLVVYAYFLLVLLGLIIYMVRATRQYGRWLRDNYADLEHKEVWQSFVVIASILLMFTFYVLGIEVPAYEFVIQVSCGLLICYLLWRVETLSDLTIEPSPIQPIEALSSERKDAPIATSSGAGGDSLDIGALLQEHCIDTQLYLQHDLSLSQLAQHISTNRTYLTQYFSRQGITYNTYINDLRIDHFVSLYREAAASRRTFTAQQLAHDSGYQSYSTFSLAFKQRMGLSVTVWMRDSAE